MVVNFKMSYAILFLLRLDNNAVLFDSCPFYVFSRHVHTCFASVSQQQTLDKQRLLLPQNALVAHRLDVGVDQLRTSPSENGAVEALPGREGHELCAGCCLAATVNAYDENDT